ncbi:MAG: SusC/RagA family TonB-linked outer membrane protein [Muribaculaceae bacterium]
MKYYRQKYMAIALALCLGATAPLCMEAAQAAQAQQTPTVQKRTIRGHIADKNGEDLIGAVVKVNGTKTIVATDLEGNYSVSYSGKGNATLSFSMLGYITKTISAAEASDGVLNVILEEEAALLDEVVVVGYGTVKKESLTSAISSIKAEDISRTAAVNTSGALAGKVPGINSRQTDGRPGHWTSINIRNMGTPLYVVDGVQMDEGQFNNIDFNDIESMSVLKDASASIYGVRAANGVVVVTTKSGKRNQKCRINLNTYYGWQSMFRYPELADAPTYVSASVQATTLLGQTPRYTREEYDAYMSGEKQGFNWKEFIWNSSAPQWYAELSASGGSEKISYYVAASHIFQESMARDFGNFQRTNIQLNVDADISDHFRMKARINGRVEDKKNAAFNIAYHGNDEYWTLQFAQVNNTPTQYPYANDNPLYPAVAGTGGYTNYACLTMDKAGEANDNWRVFQGNLEAEWEPIKGLVFKAMGSYFNSNERYKSRPLGYNLYSYDEGTDTYNVVKSFTGNFTNRWQYIETINSQLSASYKNNWNDIHTLDAFVGFETYLTNNPGVYYYGIPAMDALKVAYFNELRSFSDWNENTSSRLGYMGRINYEYKHRYLLEMSARYDGSWKFSPKHRWGFFPSVSGGWRASEESFWKDGVLGKYINNFKVRASYGREIQLMA